MFRPQRVYLNAKDSDKLTFDLFTDIEPITTDTMQNPVLNNEAEAMSSAIGSQFNAEQFLSTSYKHKKSISKARTVLNYLVQNIDNSMLRFGTNGGIYYKNVLVPEADLANVLANLVTKKSNTLVQGEYYLILMLLNAPTSVTALIHPTKLKLCGSQVTYKQTGPPIAQKTPAYHPDKLLLPPGTSKQTKVTVRTSNPFQYTPHLKSTVKNIAKQPSQVTKTKPNISMVQKRFNGPKVPAWYKVL